MADLIDRNKTREAICKGCAVCKQICDRTERQWCDTIIAIMNMPTAQPTAQERPVWHDLRKDPDDLPQDTSDARQVMIARRAYILNGIEQYTYGTIFACLVAHDDKVIAWREIEAFKAGDAE